MPRNPFVAPLPPRHRLRMWHRVRLALELLTSYVPMWRVWRRNDLAGMVATARRSTAPVPTPVEQRLETAERLGGMAFAVLRFVPADTRCLIRSLVVLRALANRSIDARLIIGVDTSDGFKAHAWVEHEGRPVLPTEGFHRLHEM